MADYTEKQDLKHIEAEYVDQRECSLLCRTAIMTDIQCSSGSEGHVADERGRQQSVSLNNNVTARYVVNSKVVVALEVLRSIRLITTVPESKTRSRDSLDPPCSTMSKNSPGTPT